MDDVFTMSTSGGGAKKMFGKLLSGESMFQNTYTANADGEIAFASSFPGEILAIELDGGKSIIAQKKAFLASEGTVNMSVFFQKKLSGGFFAKALLWRSSRAREWYFSRLTVQSRNILLPQARERLWKQAIS